MFVSDIHGREERYDKLFTAMEERVPDAVFVGGDLTPSPLAKPKHGQAFPVDFSGYLAGRFDEARSRLKDRYPSVFLILGNDDPRTIEPAVMAVEEDGLWTYCHNRHLRFMTYDVYGYAFVPPTPFLLKDWERYDVSRYTPHGSVSPEEGHRSVAVAGNHLRYSTIKEDLDELFGESSLDQAIILFHTPPHGTNLDRMADTGRMIDYVPVDLHVGSIAVRRVIETRQPRVTLHGHIHESPRVSGSWRDMIGHTHVFSAAHDGPELALVEFDPEEPESATRELL